MNNWNNLFARIGRYGMFMLLALSLTGIAQADTVTDDAVDWIITKQAQSGPETGAFEWNPASPNVYPANTQGATALGVLRAYERTSYAPALSSAVANGNCQVAGDACISGFQYTDGDHRFATHDPMFLIELSRVSGDPQYAALVDTYLWQKFATASYGASNDLDAAGFASLVLNARTGQNIPEIAAFDLAKMAIAAHLAGKSTAETAFMAVIEQSIEAADAAHQTFDVTGLAAAIWASSVTGIDLDPAIGTWAAASSTADLAAMLASYQASNGGFLYNTTTTASADLQTTAFAMQALHGIDPVQYASEIADGFSYITSTQGADGHFGTTFVEGHGETMEAYADIVLAPTDVYVDDDYVGDGFGDSEQFTHPLVNGGAAITVVYGQDAFASIADALDEVAVGGNVYVATGNYVEGDTSTGVNLVIDQPVSVFGAQAGVDARTRTGSPSTETVIVPAVGEPGLTLGSTATAVLEIASDDVILDGLVIDGDNPALTSPVALNGANPDVSSGIFAEGSNLVFENLILRNMLFVGIDGYSTSGASAGNIISHNRFTNITTPSLWGRGVILQDNFYAQVTDNLMDEVRVGVQTNNNSLAAPAGFTPSISNNEIHAVRTGIFHNLFYSNASPYTISGNQFVAVANPAATGEWSGLWVESMGSAQTVLISNNTIDGQAIVGTRPSVGYLLNNITSSLASTTVIDGGSVNGVDVGVQATDSTYYQGPVDDFLVRNVAFSDIALGAFYIEDTIEQAGSATLTIGDGNSYSNVTHTLVLSGSAATAGFADTQTGADDVLVRSARGYYFDPSSTSYTVANASINTGIEDANAGGTVHVEAGNFDENVVVNKAVTLQGPFAGTPGYDASRSGTGEAVISPATGRAVRIINTSDVVFDGFTIQNVNGTAISSGANYGGISDNVQVINNRVIDVHAGSGLYTNGPRTTPVTNWTVSNNLFRNIESSVGSGINLWAVTGGVISGNHVENSAFGGIQVNGGVDVRIVDNSVSNTAHNGINVGASQDVIVSGNDIVDANTSGTIGEAGLTLYGGTSNVTMLCNSVSGSGTNGFSTSPGIADPYSNIRVFDNAITVTSSVSHNLADPITIGSNWYGGSAPTVSGSNAGGVQLADALAATPIGTSVCTNPNPATANDPAQLVLYSGDGQSTPINTAFGQPLEARVEDALGGAVMGESITFTAPVSGASATLGTASGTSNFNGVVSTTATANALAGGYFVTASSGALEAVGFSLTNTQGVGTVVFDNLSLIYNGSAQTLVAHIAEDPSGVCTLTPATVTNAGSYPVTASCSGDNYTATGSATAVVAPAPATVTLSDLTQVFDGTPQPATVTTSPAGIAVGVTYNGSSTAPSAIGDYAVVATVTDPNYDATSASGVLHIVAGDAPDIAVTITDDRDYAQYGELLTYTITVDNLGNTEVNGTISNTLPVTLLAAEPSWTCVPVGTATCTGNGSGPLSDSFSAPPGGGVVYLLNAWVNEDQGLSTDLISNTVTVTATGDVDTSNNSATGLTQAVIFRDGFELGGDGAEWLLGIGALVELGQVDANHSAVLDLVADAVDGYIVTVATVHGGNGDRITVQAVRLGKLTLVRLSGYSDGAARFTRWTTAQLGLDRLALGLAESQDGPLLLLVGGAEDLQLPVSSAEALRVSIAPPPTG